MSYELHWVRILYRSGAIVDLHVRGFEVRKNFDNSIHAVAWVEVECAPAVLHLGVDQIAAIFDYGKEKPPQ